MRKLFIFTGFIFIALVFSNCATGPGPVKDIASDDSAFIFGHLDMTESNSGFNNVGIVEYPEKKGIRISGMDGVLTDLKVRVYTDGTYFVENVPPGGYVVYAFYGPQTRYILWNKDNIKEMEKAAFTVGKGEIVYLGTLKYSVEKKKGFFSSEKFGLVKSEKPDEKELVKLLIDFTQGTTWETKLSMHLERLNKKAAKPKKVKKARKKKKSKK